MQLLRVVCFYLFNQILHGNPGSLLIRIGKQHGKCIATEAHQQVSLTEGGTHQLGHRFQGVVAFFLPVAVVNFFEAVQIQPAQG